MNRVSAIVSAYFASEYLEGRIRNLDAQSEVAEIIAVCQENSPEHRALAAWGGRVEVVTTPNVPTVYRAWNLGIQVARGEYITNANSDDRLYPGALEMLADVLDEHPEAALVYGDADIVEQIGEAPISRFVFAEGGLDRLRQSCFVGPMPMWRKHLHAQYGYFDEKMYCAGDYEFWLRVVASGEVLHHFQRVVGAFLKRSDSAGSREPVRMLLESARARERYASDFKVEEEAPWQTPVDSNTV